MTETRKLTKADLLSGRNKIFEEYFEELGGTLDLRPLTEGQWQDALAILLAAVKGEPNKQKIKELKRKKTATPEDLQDVVGAEFNAADLIKAQKDQEVFVVSCSIVSDPPMTIDEVRQMTPPGIVGKIAAKVFEISGVNPAQAGEIESFRKK